MTAEEVVADAVERFHPRLTMACSFQPWTSSRSIAFR